MIADPATNMYDFIPKRMFLDGESAEAAVQEHISFSRGRCRRLDVAQRNVSDTEKTWTCVGDICILYVLKTSEIDVE